MATIEGLRDRCDQLWHELQWRLRLKIRHAEIAEENPTLAVNPEWQEARERNAARVQTLVCKHGQACERWARELERHAANFELQERGDDSYE